MKGNTLVKGIKRASTHAAKSDSSVRTGAIADSLSQNTASGYDDAFSQTSSPYVSVIVPVYNTKSTLQRCIDSILAQTYPNFEIIIVNDGSPDGAGELCDRIAKMHKKIHVIHQENAGLSSARNAALKIAKGEYITFVDSDDAIAPTMLEVLINLPDTPVRICAFSEITPNSKSEPKSCTNVDQQTLTTKECLRRMLLEEGFTMSACGKLYHRDLFKTVQFPLGKLYEDVGTTYRLIMQCPQIFYTPTSLYYYYQNSYSIIHQSFNFNKLDLIKLTDQMCDEIDQNFPSLQDVTNLRRMHARFSILRQMVLITPTSIESTKFRQTEQEIIQYLREHRTWVLKNLNSTHRDQFAMRTLLLGLPVFKIAWKIYAYFR